MIKQKEILGFTKSVLRTWTGPNAIKENAITGFIGEFGEALEQQHRVNKNGKWIRCSINLLLEECGDFLYYYHALCVIYDVVIEYSKPEPDAISLNVNILGSFIFACELADLIKKNCFHGKRNESKIREMLAQVPRRMLYPNELKPKFIKRAMEVNTRKIDWYAAKAKSEPEAPKRKLGPDGRPIKMSSIPVIQQRERPEDVICESCGSYFGWSSPYGITDWIGTCGNCSQLTHTAKG